MAVAANQTILVEVDYLQEAASPAIPIVGTLHIATKEYFDDADGVVYVECVNSVPNYSRGLQGERLGDYRSTLGSLELDNADGELDYVLGLALDGSEVRVYIGDRNGLRVDFQHAFTALATKAVAPSLDRISIQLKDTTAFLNKSIVGAAVGGMGPNADRPKPVNFGYVHQVEALVYDEATLTYAHSDPDTVSAATVVRDNGLDVNFVDNGDGTFVLSQSPVNPDGGITADVLSVATGSPANLDEWRVSHAFRYFIGGRAGLAADGLYLGPGLTFTPYDDDDYFVGISVAESKNFIDLLGELVDSGNCFWAITREGQFTFGRLNPHDLVDGSPSSAVEIEADDIDAGSFKIDHTSPLYYKLQSYMSRNWSQQSVLATGMEPDQRAFITRKGLYAIQPDSATTDYASSPQLYSLSLTVSPPIETLLSGSDDETDVEALLRWMERRRTMFLPWIEILSFVVGIEFFGLEIGDVVRLTMPRYGLNEGSLFQVVGVDLQLTKQKVGLQIMRRLASEFVPVDFEREMVDTTPLITGIKVPQPPQPKPPDPPIFINPTPPIFPTTPPGINVIYNEGQCGIEPNPYVDRQLNTNADYVNGTGPPSNTILRASRRIAFTRDSKYMVVGDPSFDIGGGVNGRVQVFKRSAGASSYSLVATLAQPVGTYATWGYTVSISDDYTIVVTDESSNALWGIYKSIGVDIWDVPIETVQSGGPALFASISADGLWIVVANPPNAEIWAYTGSWTLRQTVSPAAGEYINAAINWNGRRVVFNTDAGTSAKLDVWTSPDLITWSLVQSVIHGAGDGFPPFNAEVGLANGSDDIAMSEDGRVVAIGNNGVYRGGQFSGGIYVFQGLGNVFGSLAYNGVDAYVQKALITGVGTSNDGYGKALALSRDGQFLIIGANNFSPGVSSEGRAYGVNSLQSLIGETTVTPVSYVFSHPHLGVSDNRFGAAVAMNSNGAIAAIGGVDFADAGISMVRVFDNALDDLLSGITNDSFYSPISLSDVVGTHTVPSVKMIAASMEPDEVKPSGVVEGVNKSLWYQITPAANRLLSVDTLRSTKVLDPFYRFGLAQDTVIQVYTSGSPFGVGELTEVVGGFSDDAGLPLQCTQRLSKIVNLPLMAGTTYYLQVASKPLADTPKLVLRYSLQ